MAVSDGHERRQRARDVEGDVARRQHMETGNTGKRETNTGEHTAAETSPAGAPLGAGDAGARGTRGWLRRLYDKRMLVLGYGLGAATSSLLVYAAVVTKPFTFTDGSVISAAQVNSNFDSLFGEINSKETRITTLEGASWTKGSTGLYTNETKVGVGVTAPATRFEVNGAVKVGNDSTTCSSTMAGSIRWNGSQFQGCNGTNWVQLDNNRLGSGLSSSEAGLSCKAIKTDYSTSASGTYWIDPDGTGSGIAFQAYCDMSTDGGGWTLALNLDTSDGHVMWWADSLWTNSSTYGSASSPFTADHKNESFYSLTGTTKIMVVVHQQGTYVGWKSFSKVNTKTLLELLQGGDNTQIANAVQNSSTGSVWTGERLVRLSTALYANRCVQTGGGCVTASGGSPDGDRIGSGESSPSDNVGGGLGNWHDMNYCCTGSSYAGHTCNNSAFRTTSEAQAGWSSCYGGSGYFGSDTFGTAGNTCNDTTCSKANWASASGFAYDYAIFLSN